MSADQRAGVLQNWTQFRKRNHVLLVILDVLLALVLLASLSAIVWMLALGFGLLAYFAGGPDFLTLARLPVYGVPAAVVAYGLVKARLGFIFTPFAVAAAVFYVTEEMWQENLAALARIPDLPLAAADRPHELVAIDGIGTYCDTACKRIIAQSTHTLALKSTDTKDWVLFRRGDNCSGEAQAKSALDFLQWGDRGVCVARTVERNIGDALVLRVRSGWLAQDRDLPDGFAGQRIYEMSERTAGTERLLGRRIVGSLTPPLGFVLGAYHRRPVPVDIGPKIDVTEFLTIATGLSKEALTGAQPPGAGPRAASFSERLDEIERSFNSSSQEVASKALGVWQAVAAGEGHAHQEELRARLERMLASDDVRLLAAAVNVLSALRPHNRAFARDRLMELAWSPRLASDYAPIAEALKTQLAYGIGPFTAEERAHAKARFVGEAGVTPRQRQVFFIIMARGGPEQRREAVDALFSLVGAQFEEAVRDIHTGEPDVWAGNKPARWTAEEIERLLGRMKDVPSERLVRYLDAFRFGHFVSVEHKARMIEEVRERVRRADAIPDVIDKLKRMIERIPTNTAS